MFNGEFIDLYDRDENGKSKVYPPALDKNTHVNAVIVLPNGQQAQVLLNYEGMVGKKEMFSVLQNYA